MTMEPSTVNQNANADSELDVTIISVSHTMPSPAATTDINVTAQYQVTIQATVTFVNRRLGRKIFENTQVSGSTTFFTQSQHSSKANARPCRWQPRT